MPFTYNPLESVRAVCDSTFYFNAGKGKSKRLAKRQAAYKMIQLIENVQNGEMNGEDVSALGFARSDRVSTLCCLSSYDGLRRIRCEPFQLIHRSEHIEWHVPRALLRISQMPRDTLTVLRRLQRFVASSAVRCNVKRRVVMQRILL